MSTATRPDSRGTEVEAHAMQGRSEELRTCTEHILDIVLRRRRLIPEHQHLANTSTPSCRAVHRPAVEAAVRARLPVHFVLPAFPGKSPNPRKTFGSLPDLGERLALIFLQSMCEEIRSVYAPGARVTVCSDARIFGDLLAIPDEAVDGYQRAMKGLIDELGAHSIEQFGIRNAYEGSDYAAIREELLIDHGTSVFELRRRVRDGDPETRSLFNGLYRLVLEDHASLFPDLAIERRRALSKTITYRLMQRSGAWSRLVESHFPDALRLSIHPQRADSRKIGIMLVPSDDAWATPWHNVVVFRAGSPTLMRREQVEELGAELVSAQGRPSHYVISESTARALVSEAGEAIP